MKDKEKGVLEYIELSAEVTIACAFHHITTDEAGLHQADIVRRICQLEDKECQKRAGKILQIITDWGKWNLTVGGEEKFQEKYGKDTLSVLDVVEQALKEVKLNGQNSIGKS